MSTSAGAEMSAGSRSATSWKMGKLNVWSAASFSGGGDAPLGVPRITTINTAINPIATPAGAGRYRRKPGGGDAEGATGSRATGAGARGSGATGSGASGSGAIGSGATGSGATGATGSGATGSDSEDHLAGALALRHGRKGPRSLGERKPDRNVWLDLPRVVQVEEGAGGGRNEFRRALRVQAPVEPDHGVVLDEHMVCGGLRNAAGGEADDHDPSFECDALGRAVVNIATDRVEHDIGAATFGDPLDLFHEILRLVVDRGVGAQPETHSDLLVRARRRDDCGPGSFAQLNGRASDPARTGVNEESLARLQVGAAVQSEPPGLVNQSETGAFFEGHLVGHPGDRLGRGVRDFRVPAAGQTSTVQQRHDPVPGLEAGCRRCAHDLAAHLDAGHEWQLRFDLVQPGDHQRVGKVDRGGSHPDAHHAVGRLAGRDLLEVEGLRTAKLPNHPRFHRGKATAGAWTEPVGGAPHADPSKPTNRQNPYSAGVAKLGRATVC